jgi:hypothetical protein
MHENEEAPEGYMEKEKEKEKRENWVAEREEMYWVLKRVDRERERGWFSGGCNYPNELLIANAPWHSICQPRKYRYSFCT